VADGCPETIRFLAELHARYPERTQQGLRSFHHALHNVLGQVGRESSPGNAQQRAALAKAQRGQLSSPAGADAGDGRDNLTLPEGKPAGTA
jgi:hypothetical protein